MVTTSSTVDRVLSPFEVALLDIQGQACGRPVSDLLGGAVRDVGALQRLPVLQVGEPPRSRPGRVGRGAGPRRHRGPGPADGRRVRIHRDQTQGRGLPARGGDRGGTRRCARRSRTTRCGSTRTRPGRVPTSIKVGQALDGVLEYLEDPTPGIEGMAEVAARGRRCRWPPTCAWWPSTSCTPRSRRTPCRCILSDHHYWGGLRRSQLPRRDLRHLRHRAVHALQLASGHQPRGDDASGRRHPQPHATPATPTGRGRPRTSSSPAPWRSWTARWPCPTGPGLGVSSTVTRWRPLHEQYLTSGLRNRDDTGYMRTIHPTYRSTIPRW